MRLGKIMPAAADSAPAEIDLEITALAFDTREVVPGSLFFCVVGFTRDGHEFASEAVDRGAVALVVERQLPELDVPQVRVRSARVAMAPAAAAFSGDPTSTLQTIGVTGTNGKTTTAFLVQALLGAAGIQTGLLGTVKSVIGGREQEVKRTTPEAIDLQRTFRQMLEEGDQAAVMEVSSHALSLHRADAIHFAAAIFTNLTQDHLDFHPTMDDYFGAKRRLFTELGPRHSIVNSDDAYGRRLAEELPGAVTFGLRSADADFRATHVQTGLGGTRLTIRTPDGELDLHSPLTGAFNVLNVLGAVATARALGVSAEICAAAIRTGGQVPGRFQRVDEGQPFAVIVDYAHTPDSLENVLRAARELTGARVHVVFGCGGDRDRGKRPLMGEIAERLADRVVVTSDNPRSELPETIIEEILAGSGHAVEHEVDRRLAIERALGSADAGDVVVIAGKGHEQGQEFAAGETLPFDDVTVACRALQSLQRAER